MKVLLFSNDLMPYGELPTSGGGLRCYQLAEGLRSRGIEVVVSMPGFTYLAERNYAKIPQELKANLWRFETQDEIYRRVKPDAVLFASNWDHYNLAVKPDVPLIIDLHGSRLIETKMWDAPVSTERKVSVFSKADCLLSAGRRQRLYFYGWLLQAGRVPEAEHFIRYIPVSLSPDLPLRTGEAGEPTFVTGGGWFPWQNQAKAVFAICKAVKARNCGQIEIFGTPHNTVAASPEEAKILAIYEEVKRISSQCSRVQVGGYVGRSELIEIYRRRAVAVELMQYNLERELAFTTRTIEYLWCGLPVIYNNFGEISEHLREFDAGWVIDPEDDARIDAVIEEIFSDPASVRCKSENAQRLVRERFSWDKTIEPLVDFLNHPVRYAESRPVTGAAYARPAFLNARGHAVDVPLRDSLRQSFILPADHIGAVELPYVFSQDGEARPASREVPREIRVDMLLENGRKLCSRRFFVSEIKPSGRLVVRFPYFSEPKGGSRMTLVVSSVAAPAGAPELLVRGLIQAVFPLMAVEGGIAARTVSGEPSEAKALALSFVPSEFGGLYHLKVKARRACQMISQGQWTRVAHAVRRRMLSVKSKLWECA